MTWKSFCNDECQGDGGPECCDVGACTTQELRTALIDLLQELGKPNGEFEDFHKAIVNAQRALEFGVEYP
jgi:hypothetical protein